MTKAEERAEIERAMSKRKIVVRKVTKQSEIEICDDYTDQSMREAENRGYLDNVVYSQERRDV